MRILVVDDSSPHRRLLTALFGRAGHEVVTAPDGVAALEALEQAPIDAVVSDVRMPKMDGFQLCRAIRQDPRWRRLPFIFYSGIFIGDPAQDFGRDLGATAYLDAKDIAPAQVASELEKLVARHVREQYDETLGRLLSDVEFARRYHQVVLASLADGGAEDLKELVAGSAKALDDVVARLEVQHVADDGVLVHDAGRAHDVAGQPRRVERDLHVVHLGHRHLLGAQRARVLQTAQLEHQELGLGDLRDHPDQLLLHELERG